MRTTLLSILLALSASGEALRVMSFNVRYPSKDDGADRWETRRDLLVETIRRSAPDVMGTQELFYEQGEYIVKQLPEYAWFGLSRRGNREDEHMGVFYRKAALELLSSGNFWLSTTPDAPGSMSWDVTLPRMVTWGRFRDRRSGRTFVFYNTHLAHRGNDAMARVESAKVLTERMHKEPAGSDVILVGDFNTDAGSEPYRMLTSFLKDSRSEVTAPSGPPGTFHGFKGKPREGRIDWILYKGRLKPVSFETITLSEGNRYPSDHFPILAIFDWMN